MESGLHLILFPEQIICVYNEAVVQCLTGAVHLKPMFLNPTNEQDARRSLNCHLSPQDG